jgi:hypothetical protein
VQRVFGEGYASSRCREPYPECSTNYVAAEPSIGIMRGMASNCCVLSFILFLPHSK